MINLNDNELVFGMNLSILMAQKNISKIEFSDSSKADESNLITFAGFIEMLEEKLENNNVYDDEMRILLLRYGIFGERDRIQSLLYRMYQVGYLKSLETTSRTPYANSSLGIKEIQFNSEVINYPLGDIKYNHSLREFAEDLSKSSYVKLGESLSTDKSMKR